MEKYGVEHPHKSDVINEKVKQSNIKKYGVVSTLQLDEIKEKSSKTKLEKYGDEHFKLSSRPQPGYAKWSKEPWVLRTLNGPAQFRPGFTHLDGERLANAAFQEAKSKGLIRPEQLDGYIYNAGRSIGAHNGKPTSFIQVKVTPQGEVHIHPLTPK